MLRVLLLVAVLLVSPWARAVPTTYGMNIDVGEYASLPGPVHSGVYASWGVWAALDLKRVNLIPQLAVEAAPETGRWGFIPTFTAGFPVHKRIGIDATAMLMHDQHAGDWKQAEILL